MLIGRIINYTKAKTTTVRIIRNRVHLLPKINCQTREPQAWRWVQVVLCQQTKIHELCRIVCVQASTVFPCVKTFAIWTYLHGKRRQEYLSCYCCCVSEIITCLQSVNLRFGVVSMGPKENMLGGYTWTMGDMAILKACQLLKEVGQNGVEKRQLIALSDLLKRGTHKL